MTESTAQDVQPEQESPEALPPLTAEQIKSSTNTPVRGSRRPLVEQSIRGLSSILTPRALSIYSGFWP